MVGQILCRTLMQEVEVLHVLDGTASVLPDSLTVKNIRLCLHAVHLTLSES